MSTYIEEICRADTKYFYHLRDDLSSDGMDVYVCMAFCLEHFYDKNWKLSSKEGEALIVGTTECL